MLSTLAHLRNVFTVHKLNIIHGDLTGVCTAEAEFRLRSSMVLKRRQGNVLINDANEACLIDFGLSYIRAEFEGTPYWSSTVGGALRWRAPELLPPKDDHQPVLTFKCDIYSFGCVMLQVRVVVKSDRHLSLTSTTLDRHSQERFLLVTSSLIYV